jgi:RNA polymerase-binding transcription factor DksA
MRHNVLSRAELRDVRWELERERERFDESDPRRHAFTMALARVADGSYGTCQICFGVIPYQRLMAIPETMYCISCGNRA